MEYTSLIDKIMCSKICPCPEYAKQKVILRGDHFLRKYNRSISIDYMSEEEQLDFQENEENSSIVPLYFSDFEVSYATFQECYFYSFKNYLEKKKNDYD